MRNIQFLNLLVLVSLALILATVGCSSSKGGTTGGNPLSEDSSASGAVAQATGGALAASGSDGLQAYYRPQSPHSSRASFSLAPLPKAWAAGFCPTYRSIAPSKCSASGSSLWLDYNQCSFASSSAIWNGTQAFTMSSGSATCGTFPNPGAGQSLYRQYVTASGSTTPWRITVRSGYGTAGIIDDASTDLQNFDGATITPLINGGYGLKVDFNGSGGTRSALTLAHRIYVVGSYDHSITGSLNISESTTSQRTVNGSVVVYMNNARVVGTSVLSGVVHEDQCCLPTAGTITTSFSAGSNVAPTTLGDLLVGHSETLTFTGCGTAHLVEYDGTEKDVTLSRCF